MLKYRRLLFGRITAEWGLFLCDGKDPAAQKRCPYRYTKVYREKRMVTFMEESRGYERNYRRRRKQRRTKNVFFLIAAIVLLISGCGLVLRALLEPPLVLGPEAEEENRDVFSDDRLQTAGSISDHDREILQREDADVRESSRGTVSDIQGSSQGTDVDIQGNSQGTVSDIHENSQRTASDMQGNPQGDVPDLFVDLTQLYSPYAILVDCASGVTVAEHNAQERIYPASLTKIMTAVLAVENTEDLDEEITVPEDFFGQLYAEDASMAGFWPGERARLWDLLYGILLPSGAECCMTFAYRIAGSEAAFVEMMNQKAEELGLADTHFCNATGLHDPDHYSTVQDLSVLLRYALQSAAFKTAFTGSRYSVPPTRQHPDGFTFVSTMFQYMDSAEVTGGRILGGKTGYTEEAGQCLASLAEVAGREYILVTAKAPGTHETEQYHILDAEQVYSQIGAEAEADNPQDTKYWWEDE